MSAALSMTLNTNPQITSGRYLVLQKDTPRFVHQFMAAYSLLDLYAEPARRALLTPAVLCARLLGVARLLDFAHQQGIVHRNLHPACILWSESGDLAISRWEHSLTIEQASGESTTSSIGVPGYMPPEQVRKENRFEPRSDLFSLGAILYEGLTSKAPFRGTNPLEVGLDTLERESTPVQNIVSGCPLALSLLCEKLLEKVVGDRMGSAKELIEALTPFAKDITPVENDRAAAFAETMHSNEQDIAMTISEEPPVRPSKPSSRSEGSQPSRSNASQPSPYMSESQVDQLARLTGLPKVVKESYKVIDELGRGGLGRVNRVLDNRLQRVVAVKELLRYNAQSKERFLREALLTARLQHPGIIPIYEAGMWPSGEIFYSMKMVQGEPLDKLIAKHKTLEERLALLPHLLTAAEAMAYAHTNRIIHRDLKPANILVGAFGETVVIDWGLAKDLTDQNTKNDPMSEHYRAPSDNGLTMEGAIMGTPAYMPPEQAKGRPVDERADVYSLGAILYHMLAGASPYQGRNSRAVLLEVAEGKLTPLEDKQAGTPKDLLAIVKKAMATEPTQRYATAESFAKDLKKFLTGQLVEAYHYTTAEKIKRWVKKNRALLGVTAAALFIVSSIGGYSLYQVYAEQEKRISAERERTEAVNTTLQLKEVENQKLIAAQKKSAIENVLRLLETNPSKALAAIDALGADVPEGTKALWRQDAYSRGVPSSLATFDITVASLALSHKGDRVFVSTLDGKIQSLALQSKALTLLKTDKDPVRDLQLSPDGTFLLGLTNESRLFVWRDGDKLAPESAPLIQERGANAEMLKDNQWVTFISTESGGVFLKDIKSGQLITLEGQGAPTFSYDISPDERWLASGSADTKIVLWDLSQCKTRASCSPAKIINTHQASVEGVRFEQSGTLLSVDSSGLVYRHDLKTQRATPLSERPVTTLRFELSPDEKSLALNTTEGVYLLELETKISKRMPGLSSAGMLVAFSNDGKRLAVQSSNNELWLWDIAENQALPLKFHQSTITALRFTPDNQTLLSASGDGELVSWNLSEMLGEYIQPAKRALDIEVSPDQQYFATAVENGAALLWPISCLSKECDSPKTLTTKSQQLIETRFSKTAPYLAAIDERGAAFLWDLRQDSPKTLLEGGAINLSFSPTEEILAIASDTNNIELWDLKKNEHTSLVGHADIVSAIAFSPDGKTLASVSDDSTIRLWDVATRKLLRAENHAVFSLIEWSPRGDFLIASDQQFQIHRLQLKDGVTEAKVISNREHDNFLRRLSFSSDGEHFISTDYNQNVFLWETSTGERRRLPSQQIGAWVGDNILSIGPSGLLRMFK